MPRTHYDLNQINDYFHRDIDSERWISFIEVFNESLKPSMLFYIVANLFNAMMLVNYNNKNDKYVVIGLSLYITQTIYNWLSINHM